MKITSMPQAIEMTSELSAAITNAKVTVSMASPLLAYHMFACEYQVTDDPAISTAAAMVSGNTNYVFLDKTFFTKVLIDAKERAFVILHEVAHIFQQHQGRQMTMGYNHELWNISTDYQINLMVHGVYMDQNGYITRSERHKAYISLPSNIKLLYDTKYIGMSSDEIYHQLLEENGGDVQKAIDANGGGARGDSDVAAPLDSVSDEAPDSGQVARNAKTSAAAIAKGTAEKTIGEGEADLVNSLNELFKPKLNWREQLSNLTQSSVKERITYNRLSRRTDSSPDVCFPSMTGEKIKIVYGIDSSGSMSHDDYFEAGSELKGIIDQFEGWEVDLVSCDTKAHLIGQYSSEDGDDFTSIKLDLVGGGGTNMLAIVEYAQEQIDLGEEINACIIVTDGFIPDINNHMNDECHYIFVVTSAGNVNLKMENATVIYMKDIGK